jgi:glutaminyl-tRNA synthetase
MDSEPTESSDFIRTIIKEDVSRGKNDGRIATRFPPEPNGYLHIGHAKAICLNFGIQDEFEGATCNLRLDDTNPAKEEQEFVDAIRDDIHWLGFDWGDREFFASDYFEKLYEFAEKLIKQGQAYVCSLTADEVRSHRGTLTEPGTDSPDRERAIDENLKLFRAMRNGDFPDGAYTLRAKIDMKSPNMNMRDPAMYRIKRQHHHRTGDTWCIYPMYDFAHCLSDALEGITHSLCSLEFEDNRPLYDWFVEHVSPPSTPRQIEFARLKLTYTILSKRKLLQLVEENHVSGWDDPRMPTLRGMRRRGYTPESIRTLCKKVGLAKANSTVDFEFLNFCLREDLNKKALRVMAVLDPIKLVIENFPEGETETLSADNNPEDEGAGKREITFSRELFIERDDFAVDPPKKFFRLAPDREVRLKHAYYVKCTRFDLDDDGNVTTVYATYDPKTKGGWSDDGRKVKGTLHWVSAVDCVDAEVRLFEHLFTSDNPDATEEDGHFLDNLNENSLSIRKECKLERSLSEASIDQPYQFLRLGYFILDSESSKDHLVFNRTVSLKDSWSKLKKKSPS